MFSLLCIKNWMFMELCHRRRKAAEIFCSLWQKKNLKDSWVDGVGHNEKISSWFHSWRSQYSKMVSWGIIIIIKKNAEQLLGDYRSTNDHNCGSGTNRRSVGVVGNSLETTTTRPEHDTVSHSIIWKHMMLLSSLWFQAIALSRFAKYNSWIVLINC